MFTDLGPSEDDAHTPLPANTFRLPAFIEVEPGAYKPIEDCSRAEVEAAIMSLIIQGQALLDEAKALDRYLRG
jgi:hypothetical protein